MTVGCLRKMYARLALWCLLCVGAMAFNPEKAVFVPGMQPLDTHGNKVEAHGGMLYISPGRTYYWIGEGKKAGCLNDPPPYAWGCEPQTLEMSDGINLYSSGDLQHWELQGQLLKASQVYDANCYPDCRLERPKLVWNPNTRKWTILFHISTPDLGKPGIFSGVGVATADVITGPYTYITSFLPNGWSSYDMNVFQDGNKTFLIRALGSEPTAHLTISQLNPDYIGVGDPVAYTVRGEGPAMFKSGNYFYLLFSNISWWDPNRAALSRSNTMTPANKWFDLQQPPVDGLNSNTTFNSQPTYVLPFPCDSGKTLFIYMGDRWNLRGPGGLTNASYVWLPLLPRKEDPSLYHIVYRESWSPREYC